MSPAYPTIRGTTPPPFANEIISVIALVSTLCWIAYTLWQIQKNGLTAFRKSTLFYLAFQLCLNGYLVMR
jgi:hypothetical protein